MKTANQQNLTVRLRTETIRKAKVLAAKQSTSISALVADHIESLAEKDEAYERAKHRALALLDKGFHMGGVIAATRDELHER